MTYRQKYNENKRLIKNYIAFLDQCKSYNKKLKLCTEIGRLNEQQKQIEKMSFEETRLHIYSSKIHVNSLL